MEIFWIYFGVRRSSYLMYLFVVWGKDSEDILRDYFFEFSLGENFFFERFYKKYVFVLLLGVGFGNNIFFYLVEYWILYWNVI